MGRKVAVRLVRADRGREHRALRPGSQAEGFRFLAEVLRTAGRAKTDPELLATLGAGLPSSTSTTASAGYLSDSAPGEEKLAALVEEAEAITVTCSLRRTREDSPPPHRRLRPVRRP